ncbi:hypothetical protein L1887_22387 [Cichorium endivia]|nr:hypothetical protein L1887_22387 [Cichorium endivia]
MGKQTRSKKSESAIGKGKVTPIQVAFIVDRYLLDNNFVRTRSAFRSEASHLIPKSPVNEEKIRLEQEKFRVQTLLRGMQDAMNAYNGGGPSASAAAPLPSSVVMPTLPAGAIMASPAGAAKSIYQPVMLSNNREAALQITPVPLTSHVSPPTKPSHAQGSSVAKCLFNPSSHSPGPQTPSPPSIDKSVSPAINHTPLSSNKKTLTPPKFTSSNRTVITSETIQVSPSKQVSYYSIERNHCISSPMKTSSKRFGSREHVKGRLDFDGSEMAEMNSGMVTSDENTGSPSEDDAFDFDLPNLDCLGVDFNLTDLLGDFDYFGQPDNGSGSSPESLSGSPDKMIDCGTGDHELVSGMSSTVTEILSEQDMNKPGPNSVTTVKSVTKSIKVFSPVKPRKTKGGLDEDC